MLTKIQKWGHSYALRIPKSMALELKLGPDSPIEIRLEDEHIVISPVLQPEYSLDELLGDITPQNLHAEIETGSPAGNEAW